MRFSNPVVRLPQLHRVANLPLRSQFVEKGTLVQTLPAAELVESMHENAHFAHVPDGALREVSRNPLRTHKVIVVQIEVRATQRP